MIRWSYAAPRLVLLAVIWGFFAFFFDRLVERGLEAAGSKAVGAKVEIGRLRIDFFPPQAEVIEFAAADPGQPMQNAAEFQRARFKLQGRPLLEKKIVIEAAAIEGLAWGTPRKTSGALPKAPSSPAVEKLKSWAKTSAGATVIAGRVKEEAGARYKVDPKELGSLKKAEELEKKWPAAFKAYEQRIADFKAEERIKELESLADQLAKSGGSPLEKIEKAKELTSRSKELQAGLRELRASVEAAAKDSKLDLAALEAAKRGDVDALMAKLKLPSFDAERLSSYVLGPAAAAKLQKVLRLIELARSRMPAKNAPAKTVAAAASRGRDVEFPKTRSWPSWWLIAAQLSGTADLGGAIVFKGEARDFSSNPPLVGKPARLQLAGGSKGRSVSLTGLLDHTKERPKDSISFRYSGLPVEALTGGGGDFSLAVSPGVADVSGTIELDGPALGGTISFAETGISLKPTVAGQDPKLARVIENSFSGIKSISARLTLGGTIEDPQFRLSSNLGDALAQGLKQSLGAEIAAQKQALETQVQAIVGQKQAALNQQLTGSQKELLSKIGVGEDKLKAVQDKIAQAVKTPLPDLKKIFR